MTQPLQFPTLAEQTLSKWDHKTSLVTLALAAGADYQRSGREIHLTFDDDTSLVITGRERNHKVMAVLP